MKYKVGDNVRIKSIAWYNRVKNRNGYIHMTQQANFYPDMSACCGFEAIITRIHPSFGYRLCINGSEIDFWWAAYMFEDRKQKLCVYCNEHAKAIVSDQKHEETVIFINDDELCLEYGDSLHCEKINYCPMCGRKL